MLPEKEAKINIEVGDDVYELRPDNTEVYTHIGRLALYDCIYHEVDEEDAALYIFREQPGFVEVATVLLSNGFPAFFNQREVEPWLRESYEKKIIGEVLDSIPDGLDENDLQ